MGIVFFSNLEFYFISTFLVISFCITFLKNFITNIKQIISTPILEKKTKKTYESFTHENEQQTILLILFLIMLTTNVNKQIQYNLQIQETKWIPFMILVLIFFLKILKIINKFFFVNRGITQKTWVSANAFLFLFIPVTASMLTATNFLDIILPFEIFSFLFYFIFLEYSVFENKNKNKFKTLLRSFLYYYWLSFLGSIFLLAATFFLFINLPTTEFFLLEKYFLTLNNNNWTKLLFPSAFLIGFFIKMGSIFFFFFKANFYKILSISGVLILSLYSTFFYFFIFYYFLCKLPILVYYAKWVLLPLFTLLLTWLILIFNFQFTNIYLFIGFSTVLTGVFCILLFM